MKDPQSFETVMAMYAEECRAAGDNDTADRVDSMLEARRCWQEAEREVSAAGLALQSGLEEFASDKKDLDNAMKDIERKQRALDAECLEDELH